MQPNDIVKELSSLAQLDIDAIHAYEAAIKNVDVLDIRTQLEQFRLDHDRHVRDLSAVIIRLGGSPPKYSPDFKGFVIQGFTALRSQTGNEGALKAMKSNEELTNKTYAKAIGMDLPPDIKALVQRNYADEQRHLQSIERWLNSRAWESAGAHI